jgi:predicted Zn-dependent protease
VEKSQIQHPFHEITITGNLHTLLQTIVAVGNAVDQRDSIHRGALLLES